MSMHFELVSVLVLPVQEANIVTRIQYTEEAKLRFCTYQTCALFNDTVSS